MQCMNDLPASNTAVNHTTGMFQKVVIYIVEKTNKQKPRMINVFSGYSLLTCFLPLLFYSKLTQNVTSGTSTCLEMSDSNKPSATEETRSYDEVISCVHFKDNGTFCTCVAQKVSNPVQIRTSSGTFPQKHTLHWLLQSLWPAVQKNNVPSYPATP